MVDDDPFAEPDDNERTVIRPNPAGRRPVLAPQPGPPKPLPNTTPPAPRQDASTGTLAELGAAMTGPNALNAAAANLFALIGRVRNRAQHPNPDELRRSVVAEIRAFESRALQAGIDQQKARVARYALCATIDDIVLNTPWAAESSWAQQSMVATFHRETVGGDRFYDLLARLEQDPANNIELLEFLYTCLSLGFEGRLRVEEGGRDRHAEILLGLYRIISGQRGHPPQDLSPHWEGVKRPHRPLSAWKPVWIATGVLSAVLLCAFLALSYILGLSTQGIAGQLAVLDPPGVAKLDRPAPVALPPPVVKEDTRQLEQVTGFLQEAVEAGLVTTFQDSNTITVRLNGANMFAPGSDRLQPQFEKPLEAVARALNESTTGPVLIAGHSDSDPIRTARYPDNMALSLARAERVRKKLAGMVDDPSRLSAEGRSDSEPIATNDTAAGKAQNRRIEIILLREGVQQGGLD
ncbi:Outer membrane protein ImpK/VasF, OmpA/MotB domain [Rhodovulum sp. P5]|uniref:type IVB secretion system protein IcmH/DotU n=1 Tax=Rhodovulum sp. P5 TaxID=1564506 RepID=UPI0009C3CA7C|nr:type IVB secretion system protein IcmH/DotU [Rhodovulum sp. P5]ARE41185.1 Outer membrane protein ImpK/VasF, OmpA/MotB domain [Rhodovulum sp. P5]